MSALNLESITALVAQLSLEEKVRVLTGRNDWTTWPLEAIGLRSIVMSDGPSGVRGELWDERSPSLNFPSASALSSSWDDALAYDYAVGAASEARRKGVDVVLGPTINLHRSPLGGRHFEAFSEDPVLTGNLAAAYVRGLQNHGIAATPKHYVANDSETNRFTVDVIASDRTLRELYLAAFEPAVVEANAWTVMSSYNSVNGSTMTENVLLETPLRSEWRFDGVVISDWTAVRSLRSAAFEQDLVMPGPKGPWGDALVEAVRAGDIEEATIDRKVQRILLLAARVGALRDFPVEAPPMMPFDGPAFIRRAAIEGTVLVKNDGVLPAPDVTSIAVIGASAVDARTQGGGSSTVLPERTVSPLEGIQAAYGSATVTYSPGTVHEGLSALTLDEITVPDSGHPGAKIRLLDESGQVLLAEERQSANALVFALDTTPPQTHTVEFTTRWTPATTGRFEVGVITVGTVRMRIDDNVVAETTLKPDGDDIASDVFDPPSMSVEIDVTANQPLDIGIAVDVASIPVVLTVGTRPVIDDPAAMIAAAAAEAARADIAVVVVGTTARVESEGFDRTTLALPGNQDELVTAVCAANPRTVVVVNSGAPVLTPWRHDAAAVLLSWFGGQEYGHALAEIISGTSEPGGRLPTTWPAAPDAVPVLNTTPVDGRLPYDEGLDIGYRAYLKDGVEPAFWFGAGLGYTTWKFGDPTVSVQNEGDVLVAVTVQNTGDRPGKQVVQLYASRPDSAVTRPVRWLVGYQVVRAAPGGEEIVEVAVSRRAFAHWTAAGWKVEPGEFSLAVGTSVNELFATTVVTPSRV